MAQGGGRGTRSRSVNTESAGTAGSPAGRSGRGRLEGAEPEVVFRIVHVAVDDGPSSTETPPPTSYREQAVEIVLGPNPTFQNGCVAALIRRAPPDQVVNAVPPSRRKARPPRRPKPVGPPRIVETLRNAIEWHRQLDVGEVPHQAAIARREGITRARVTQILGLLRLAPAIQNHILTLPETAGRLAISERVLRPIARMGKPVHQLTAFSELTGKLAPGSLSCLQPPIP